jgi:cyclomaltodextrinase
MSVYFDSKDPRCKSPFGAVLCGTEVSFAVFFDPEDGILGGELQVREEFAGVTRTISLRRESSALRGTYTAPGTPELAWYSFTLRRQDGRAVTLPERQLTVYEDTVTPDWFGRGVSYQIFPDRFCRSRIPDPAGMVGDRRVHESWADTPDFLPDEQGEVRCRDFFGGDLPGIIGKLDYLQELGVTTLYLTPIFESASNHRYNTADYRAIDPMLGTEEDFCALCSHAHRRGMRVVLDGVFNHTGSVSRYFNADGSYPDLGAAQSKESPYYNWYRFTRWPEEYDAWWGIKTLPAVEETQASYREFIIQGEDSVVRHWLRCGADGWRLDVADELPDSFIAQLRAALEKEKADAVLLGEVWEDQQDRLRSAPPLSPGPGNPRAHELPLPQGGHGLAAGRRCCRLPRQHGNPSGELSGPRLLQCHELSGHSRYAPDPDPSGRQAHTGEQDGTGSSPAYPGRI